MKQIVIIGSTGSIGASTLQVIRRHPDKFKVLALVAGSNSEELSKQVEEFKPEYAGINSKSTEQLQIICKKNKCELISNADEIIKLASLANSDITVQAAVGAAGLPYVLESLEKGKTIALANKESLVVGGHLVKKLLETKKGKIFPIDSEHSAIFQCLQGERTQDIESITITASGGPFLNKPLAEFSAITPEMALKHPNWSMGAKVTIDSSTMVNKVLELIEAKWLFNLLPSQIKVLIHPQSIVHSFVSFKDGSSIMQASNPDMIGPISYALGYPEGRLTNIVKTLNLGEIQKLEFFPLDQERYPAIRFAQPALEDPSKAAILNFADEVAVSMFLSKKIGYSDIYKIIDTTIDKLSSKVTQINSLDDVYQVKKLTENFINNL